ncbi:MAG: LPS export ABC transporter ATP-binding protein [Deltaproteobacteria bacterium]|nr:LPS export ABC transporter ATP-binding protein [Deltaproteobacteria bacterium]
MNKEAAAHTLCTRHIVKSYSGRHVVDDVSIEVRAGEIVGLLGPNGAGKTTTFYTCVGLVSPDSGTVELDGLDITREPMYVRARQGIGYLPQEPSVFRKLSVSENVMAILETMPFESDALRRERHDELLDFLGLNHLVNSMAASLSGGERRRVEITRTLARSPHFILLDEPFAGIDPLAIRDIQGIIEKLRDTGIGVLITDHNVRETLGTCDRAYIMVDGKVLEEGAPEVIAASERAQRYYLGSDFSL